MAEAKVYPKGIRVFAPHKNAPLFIKGSMKINVNEFISWLKQNESYLSDYKGDKQLTLDIADGKDSLYVTVNTFKPKGDTGDLKF